MRIELEVRVCGLWNDLHARAPANVSPFVCSPETSRYRSREAVSVFSGVSLLHSVSHSSSLESET